MSERRCDVVVCGAGVVGLAAALALVRAGWDVALVDPGPAPPPAREGGAHALRVSTLNLAAQRIIASLGAWEGVVQRRVYPFTGMYVWDAGGAGHIRFDAQALDAPQLGFVAENAVLRAALHEELQAHPGVSLLFGAGLRELDIGEQVRCTLDDGERLTARLVIGADGHDSRVRAAAALGVRYADYEQTALVCNVRTERDHAGTAWQRFLSTGPLAFLPLAAHQCSIVWSLQNARYGELAALPAAELAGRLGAALEHRLGEVTVLGEWAGFPLRRQHALRYVAERVALIGDAAHTIHPLAGQGLNIGLLDAAALAQALGAPGGDPGALRPLRAYERWRHGENQIMQSAMDAFHYLFGNRHYGLRWLRNAGLTLADACAPAKAYLARRAMGLGGELPELARGA